VRPLVLVRPLVFAIICAVAALVPSWSAPESAAAASCTGWTSKVTPPTNIRVLRVATGRVQTVDFRYYVVHVVAREWGDTLPRELQRAGATAVKQYAWYWTMHWRGGRSGGRCFDVKDSSADQIYRVGVKVSDRMRRAVSSTWQITLRRDGRFFPTTYRPGEPGPCAYNAGRRLYSASARRCANLGWSAGRILGQYYNATVHQPGG
jgi:peptidoglycan hydrolase-like amidase